MRHKWLRHLFLSITLTEIADSLAINFSTAKTEYRNPLSTSTGELYIRDFGANIDRQCPKSSELSVLLVTKVNLNHNMLVHIPSSRFYPRLTLRPIRR